MGAEAYDVEECPRSLQFVQRRVCISMFEWFSDSQPDSADSSSRPSTNAEWLSALQEPEPDPDALDALRNLLIQGLQAALQKRVPRRADALAEDFAQDAMVKILDKLDSFRGDSQFTTWAQKIAIRTAFTGLRRKRWENVSLDELTADEGASPEPNATAASPSHPDPADETNQQLLLDRVQALIRETLTDRQRTAIQAVMRDMPLDEVARRMDTNRNALYKVIHDARQKMKRTLEEEGLSVEQLLAELR